jgi:hypothetical protein
VYEHLLEQAVTLAMLDTRRPKQANLRRAISAAYYALFHLLVDEACRARIGSLHDQAPFRQVLGRAFAHNVMNEACKSFAGGTLKKGVSKGLPVGLRIPVDIRDLAATFVDLQDKRHLADYDLTERFNRSDVVTLITRVRTDIERSKNLAPADEQRFFLACLWAWKDLANR